MDSFQVTITVLSSVLTGLLTLVCTKGVDAYLKVRKDHREAVAEKTTAALTEQHHQEDRVETKQEEQIADLKEQVKTLQADLKAVQHDHVECVKAQAELRGDNKAMASHIELLQSEVESLRKWRHDLSTPLQIEVLKKAIASMPQSPEPG